MINFSGIPMTSFLGGLLRKLFSLIPKGFVVPILQGPLKGARWVVGSQTHGMWLGSYEIDKQQAMKKQLKAGQVFYDIGANVGFYSLLASRYIGSKGLVVAFEPLPRNIEYFSRHLQINKAINVKVIPKALSDHSGTERFFFDANPSSCHISAEGNIEVAITTLDEIIKEKDLAPPNIIKVDIEGAEIDFLKGAINTLLTQRPLIFMAVHSSELFRLLVKTITEDKLSYTINDLKGNRVEDNVYLDEVMLVPC